MFRPLAPKVIIFDAVDDVVNETALCFNLVALLYRSSLALRAKMSSSNTAGRASGKQRGKFSATNR